MIGKDGSTATVVLTQLELYEVARACHRTYGKGEVYSSIPPAVIVGIRASLLSAFDDIGEKRTFESLWPDPVSQDESP